MAEGSYQINVRSYVTESNLTDAECDLTNNEAFADDVLTLTVTADDVPVITNPQEVCVDETDFSAQDPLTADGQLVADFGADTGTFAATTANSFTASTNIQTTRGLDIDVTLNGNTYVGTASNGNVVFTLEINSNGSYTFRQFETMKHPDATDHNDEITLSFGARATDVDGDMDTATITVCVLDDGPTAYDDMNCYDAADCGTFGNVITNANQEPGGADSLSEDNPNVVFEVSFGGTTVSVPTNGSATIQGNNGYLVINSNGSYQYSLTSKASGLVQDVFTYGICDGDQDIDYA